MNIVKNKSMDNVITVEQEEGNKLIAEFEKLEYAGGTHYYRGGMLTRLKYHSRWDWIMPIVEQIGGYEIAQGECTFYSHEPPKEIGCMNEDTLTAIWEATVGQIMDAVKQLIREKDNSPMTKAVGSLIGGNVYGFNPPLNWNIPLFGRMMGKPYLNRLITAAALIAAEIDRLQAKESNLAIDSSTLKG